MRHTKHYPISLDTHKTTPYLTVSVFVATTALGDHRCGRSSAQDLEDMLELDLRALPRLFFRESPWWQRIKPVQEGRIAE